ncbi:MAG: hypothetical protein LLG14_14670 [Nocardiaceae bacterium]|nr:hypothetical protein [Nocardiaceae bacterium]
MKRIWVGIAAAVGISVVGSFAPAAASGGYPTNKIGIDISWPNCGAAQPKVAYRIVGVTGGRPFTKNPCLKEQAKDVYWPNLSLYVNTEWHGATKGISRTYPKQCRDNDKVCLAYNYGFAAGLHAFKTALDSKIVSDKWWLDVETDNDWTKNYAQNRASIQGTYDALKKRGISTVGVYSTPSLWWQITGGWKPGWPNWVAMGSNSAKHAKQFCNGKEFTGGPTLIVQYIPPRPYLDHNVAC